MEVNVLNSLHMEYRHRFKVEFQQLLEQQTFASAIFRNSELLFQNSDAPFRHTLEHCFRFSFESMALGLSRIWDERNGDQHLISIPNLVSVFENHKFLGCQSLAVGKGDRATYESLYVDTLRMRLRVVRTEALAHSLVVGKSRDRDRSDLAGKKEFDIVNGDALAFCHKTLVLLFSLNDQLTMSKWRAKRTMAEMTGEWNDKHIAFLRHFVSEVQ